MAKEYKINRRLLSYEEKLDRVRFYNDDPYRGGPKVDEKEFTSRVIYDETVTLKCDRCGSEYTEDLEILEEVFGDDTPEITCIRCSKGTMRPELIKK